jgi:hypothetical protein
MKKIAFLVFNFYVLTAVAQPILDSANTSPVVGETFNRMALSISSFNPGTAGTNQTWNFSNLSNTGSSSENIVDPSGTPYFINYPISNLCVQYHSDYYDYFTSTDSAYYLSGQQMGAGSDIVYTDQKKLLQFPFTYNNQFADYYLTNLFLDPSWYTNRAFGTMNITADGYGTVITPADTFTNALRIHYSDYETDSDWTSSGLIVYFMNIQTYEWRVPGIHYPVFITTDYGNGTRYAGYLLPPFNLGISNARLNESITISPNPTSGTLTIKANFFPIREIQLLNLLGESVLTFLLPPGDIRDANCTLPTELDISSLPSGIYILQTSEGKNLWRGKVIKE